MDHAGTWVFIFLSVGSVSLFSFLAVSSWADSRRREREAFYKSEALKKVIETHGEGSNVVLDYIREQARISHNRRREGLKLGGMVTAAVGLGLMIFFGGIARNQPVYLLGVIPLLVGVVFLIYAYFLSSRI